MRIYGRVTIYGEYLMHGNIPGLIMPSNLFMQTSPLSDIDSIYYSHLDSVLKIIKQEGLAQGEMLNGNLPLGYGLAGSTTLSFLHLNKIENLQLKRELIDKIDKKIHGFIPSGLDFESCIHQKWGLFCSHSGWRSIRPLSIDYFLVIFPKEQKMKLNDIQEKILMSRNNLESIQKSLNLIIDNNNLIDLDLLMEYSKILLKTQVYSDSVNEFISYSIKNNWIAKGIGGLYDKAVLVIPYRNNKGSRLDIENIANSLNANII